MKLPSTENIGELSTSVTVRKTGSIDITNNDYAPRPYGTNAIIQDLIDDNKKYVQYVKGIVQLVRKSVEYKNYIQFLHGEVELNNSALLKGVNTFNTSIEIHHAVFQIFDIVDIVIQQYIRNNKSFQSMQIANEVMQCHYDNIVPLVPLDKTSHELVHSGELFIKFEHIFGDIRKFLKKYAIGLNGEQLEMLKTFIRLNQDGIIDKKNQYTLNVKPVTWMLESSYKEVGLLNHVVENKKDDAEKNKSTVKQSISDILEASETILKK